MPVQGKTHCSRCGISFDNDESTVLTIRPIHYNARIRAKCFKLCPQCDAKMREVLDGEMVYTKFIKQQ